MSLNHCHSDTTSSENCSCFFQLDEVNYIWTIDDFSAREEKNETIYSPEFSSVTNKNCKWYLEVGPCKMVDDEIYLAVYLNLSSSSKSTKVCAKYNFYILNEKQEKIWSYENEFLYYAFFNTTLGEVRKHDDGFGFFDFCKKNEFFKNSLLINDKLTISCKLTFFETSEENLKVFFHRFIPVSLQHLSEDLASMRENTNLTDVVLSVQGKDYPAHKGMLAARSKVFAAMFNHDTKENKENRVLIEDMNAEVMEEMLRYIYTGDCKDAEKLSDGLLAAAEKYDLADLKRICEESLNKNLTVENAASILVLADTYRVNTLKSKVIDFIIVRSSEVLGTANWKNIMLSYPVLLNEVLFESLTRRNATS